MLSTDHPGSRFALPRSATPNSPRLMICVTVGKGPTHYPLLGSTIEFLANAEVLPDFFLKYSRQNGFKTSWPLSIISLGPFSAGALHPTPHWENRVTRATSTPAPHDRLPKAPAAREKKVPNMNPPAPLGGFVLCTPEAVRHVLKDNFESYEKTEIIQEPLSEFLGNGIFTSDGDIWKLHRKVAVQMFSRSFLREATFVAAEEAGKVVKRINGFVASGKSFDLQNIFFAFTIDVFALIAFGVDLHSIELDEPHPFAKAFDRVQQLCNDRCVGGFSLPRVRCASPGFARPSPAISAAYAFLCRFPNPFWRFGKMFRSSTEREITDGCKVIHQFAADVIASKRQSLSRGQELGLDLLSRFIQKKDMTNEEMTDVVLNFMIAGRDTTAAGMSWTMYELLHNPEHLGTIRKELKDCLDEKHGGVDFSNLSHEDQFTVVETELPYLRAVVLEGLRMHPSVMKDVKFCVKDDVLPDGSVVKKGMAVLYAPFVLCRNPNVWEEPDKFNPSRFLEKVGGSHRLSNANVDAATSSLHKPVNVSDFEYPVFNAGPRVCLGRSLALLEMMLMLATLIPHFDFEFAHPHDAAYTSSLVSQLKHGLILNAKPRK